MLVSTTSSGSPVASLISTETGPSKSARQNTTHTHRMKHATRSPITGRFIAKRATGADLVDAHNKGIRRRRLWDLLDAVGMAILFGMVGFFTVWTLAIVWGVCK